MQTLSVLLGVLPFLGNVIGQGLDLTQGPQAGVLKADFVKVQQDVNFNDVLLQRRQIVAAVNRPQDQYLAYVLNLTVGTPPRQASVQMDTASSDLWLQALDTSNCQQPNSDCGLYTTYKTSQSSTAKLLVRNASQVGYALGSASADLYNETVSLGNATFPNYPIRVASTSDQFPFGIMGLGPQSGAVNTYRPNTKNATLPTFLQSLYWAGYIGSQSFSFWLNGTSTQSLVTSNFQRANVTPAGGSVVFGGVDKARYQGDLTVFAMLTTYPGSPTHYGLTANTFNVRSVNGTAVQQTIDTYAILDTGTSYTFAPGSIIQPIYQYLGIDYDAVMQSNSASNGSIPFPCSNADNYTVTFGFGKAPQPTASFDIPISEFMSNGTSGCFLHLAPTFGGRNYFLLGDNFLHSFYTLIDVDAQAIGLARVNPNTTQSNIVPNIKGQPIPGTEITA